MDTKLTVLDMEGQNVGEYTVDTAVLEQEKGEQAVKDVVVAFNNALRANTACTKTRGLIRGGGAKPWRQKGSGRARVGSSRNPIWRGGGVVFGPMANRNYNKKVNKKVRQLALRRAFTDRLAAGDIIVLDKIELANSKTSLVVDMLKKLDIDRKTCIIEVNAYFNENLEFATRNLFRDGKGIDLQDAATVNVYSLLHYNKFVITRDALAVLEQRMKGNEK